MDKEPKQNTIGKRVVKLLGTGAAIAVGVASPVLIGDATRADAQPNPRGADTTATPNPNSGVPSPETQQTDTPIESTTTSTTETTTSTTLPEATTTSTTEPNEETTTSTTTDAPPTKVEKGPGATEPQPVVIVDNGGIDGPEGGISLQADPTTLPDQSEILARTGGSKIPGGTPLAVETALSAIGVGAFAAQANNKRRPGA
jgi:hypothetical protein